MPELLYVVLAGDIKPNNVSGASNFSESTSEHKITVPQGKRWYLIAGLVNRDANATVVVRVKDASDEPLIELLNKAAGTGMNDLPDAGKSFTGIIPLLGTWYIHFNFGAAQGAGAKISLVVLEVPR